MTDLWTFERVSETSDRGAVTGVLRSLLTNPNELPEPDTNGPFAVVNMGSKGFRDFTVAELIAAFKVATGPDRADKKHQIPSLKAALVAMGQNPDKINAPERAFI